MRQTPAVIPVDDPILPQRYLRRSLLPPSISGAVRSNWVFPINWYWLVADSSPGTQVWQSKTGQFVSLGNADYVAFITAGLVAVSIDTFANLCVYIDKSNQTRTEQFQGFNNISVVAPLALTPLGGVSPIMNHMMVQPAGGGSGPLTLPQANLFGSPPLGFSYLLTNIGNITFPVNDFSGNLIINSVTLTQWLLFNSDNTTQAGTWIAEPQTDNFGWTGYSPVISSAGGAITSVSSTCRFKIWGKSVSLSLDITINTVGTATGDLIVALPSTCNTGFGLVGREWAITNKGVCGGQVASSSNAHLFYADGTSIFASGNGTHVIVTGVYESQ